ncbi:MAG TPA: hypothetical protein VFW96_15825 [Thermomicrobiales bacterium]|nr:hypothetical protein [Thermomicrobiales bacterium]
MAQQTSVASPLLAKIRERGHWRVVIRPGRFERERIPDIAALYPLLRERAVRLRGWQFPQVTVGQDYRIGLDWIDKEVEVREYVEYWRLYQSGQFLDVAGLPIDWLDHSAFPVAPPDWQPGQYLPVVDVLYRYTEIFEFAARLALIEAYSISDWVHLEIALRGLHGRRLYNDVPGTTIFLSDREAQIEEFPYEADLPRSELIADAHRLALHQAEQLCQRFGGSQTPGLLESIQAKFVRS